MSENLINELQENLEQLKKVVQLDKKLEGEDKMTLNWLICGYSENVKIVNKTIDYIQTHITKREKRWGYTNYIDVVEVLELDNKELVELLEILRGEEND